MTENASTTTGRRMTKALQDAIDNCPGSRLMAADALDHAAAQGGRLARIHRALALELRLAELHEQDMLRHLAAARQDDLDTLISPPPPATGPAMFLDPDTGERHVATD